MKKLIAIRDLHNPAEYGTVREGQAFFAREKTAESLIGRGLAREPTPVEVAPSLDPVIEKAPDPEPPKPAPEWPLKTPPAEYLKIYPKGPNAALAREILDS